MQSRKIVVKGRVQGVYFRAYTKKAAKQFNITGTVKNRTDGSVEIQAKATAQNMQKFVQWCHAGPLLAKVTQVTVMQLADAVEFGSFEIID